MKASDINILIACEESQVECKAFRQAGCNAFSCDIQPCRKSGKPEWHIHGDVTPFLKGVTQFTTQDGVRHNVLRWHLIIAHPPCTYLCKMGSVWMWKDGHIVWSRFREMILARRFFFRCLNAEADFCCVENPLPMARACLPKPTCYVQPYWFGSKYSKKTLYWLRNLPPLMPMFDNVPTRQYVKSSRGKYRSVSFQCIADAMVSQWLPILCEGV